jgi:hypothetical protein
MTTGRAWLAITAVAVAACAHRVAPGVQGVVSAPVLPTPGAATAAAGAADPATPIGDIAPERALDPGEPDVIVVVRASLLRDHVSARRLASFFAAIPGWRTTLRALSDDPLRDFDWLLFAGPSAPATDRAGMIARMRIDDAAVDRTLRDLATRATEPASSLVASPRVVAAVASVDGTTRVVMRAQPGIVAAVPREQALAVSRAMLASHVADPRDGGEQAVRVAIAHPHALTAVMPAELERVRAWVVLRGDGGADATFEGDCADGAAASKVADTWRADLAKAGIIGRMMTHGLTDAITIDAEASTVVVRVPATRDQLEATLDAIAAFGAFDAP